MLLSLGQVVCMAKEPESGHIRTGFYLVFIKSCHQSVVQRSHIFYSKRISVLDGILFFIQFLELVWHLGHPLVRVDGHLRPNGLGQYQPIPWLGMNGDKRFFFGGYGAPTDHGIRVFDTLAPRYVGPGLFASVNKPFDHMSGDYILLVQVHFLRNPQNLEN